MNSSALLQNLVFFHKISFTQHFKCYISYFITFFSNNASNYTEISMVIVRTQAISKLDNFSKSQKISIAPMCLFQKSMVQGGVIILAWSLFNSHFSSLWLGDKNKLDGLWEKK